MSRRRNRSRRRARRAQTQPPQASPDQSSVQNARGAQSPRDYQRVDEHELHARVEEDGMDQVIYEEMVRYGFWTEDGVPESPREEEERLQELQSRLSAAQTEMLRLHNIEGMRRAANQQRMEESRRRREETKDRKIRERAERAAAWQERKQRDILFLGRETSNTLQNEDDADQERLDRFGLPALNTASALAQAMNISVSELRFLTYTRRASRVNHYIRFKIPKKSGGERLISAPMPKLKAAQTWVLHNILYKVPVHDAAHGFVQGRSIVSNAQPHVGTAAVINLDLQDFFPTIKFRRVFGVFRALGYSRAASTILSLLCTEPEVEEVEMDGERWFVQVGERFLPQGAPTSPAITNILCHRLDRRLAGSAKQLGFSYTRYADDLTFSRDEPGEGAIARMLGRARGIVKEEGFVVHPKKTRVLRKGRQQEVTGVVVNEKLNVDRKTLRKFRALLFQIEKDGPQGKSWGTSGDVIASIDGFANFVLMVNPQRGGELKARVNTLMEKYGYAHGGRPSRTGATPNAPASDNVSPAPSLVEESTETEAPQNDWWKLW